MSILILGASYLSKAPSPSIFITRASILEKKAENSIAIDIRAHIGLHTLTMSRKVGAEGSIIAFEPQNIYMQSSYKT